ncbi:MAG: hypothetical protein KDE53_34830 [Caldilineaceae bacterium]|nr:hypothetical protein [Caldilineaceae bacterium]
MEHLFFGFRCHRATTSFARSLAVFCLAIGLYTWQSIALVAAAPNERNGIIYGVVWVDYNRNGVLDAAEPTVAGQTVFVTPDIESDFAQILVLSTDEKGEFNATNLTPGSYRVWAATQDEDAAKVVHVTGDRSVMTVQIPLVGFTLFMPQIVR